MGREGIILVNPPITTFQQSLTHSALPLKQANLQESVAIPAGNFHV